MMGLGGEGAGVLCHHAPSSAINSRRWISASCSAPMDESLDMSDCTVFWYVFIRFAICVLGGEREVCVRERERCTCGVVCTEARERVDCQNEGVL